MAAVQTCDQHPDTEAVVIVHLLAGAEFSGLCLACLCDYASALLTEFAPDRLAPPPAAKPRRKRAAAAAPVADDSEGGDTDGSRSVEGEGPAASNGQAARDSVDRSLAG